MRPGNVLPLSDTSGPTHSGSALLFPGITPMARRANPLTRSTVYRVYRLSESARKALDARKGVTIREHIEVAVRDRLPVLVSGLLELGVCAPGETCLVRLPVSDAVLAKLAKASEITGISAASLLRSVL